MSDDSNTTSAEKLSNTYSAKLAIQLQAPSPLMDMIILTSQIVRFTKIEMTMTEMSTMMTAW